MAVRRGSLPFSSTSRKRASARAFARCSSCVYAPRPLEATSARTASASASASAETVGAELALVPRVRAVCTYSRTTARSRRSLWCRRLAAHVARLVAASAREASSEALLGGSRAAALQSSTTCVLKTNSNQYRIYKKNQDMKP